MVRARRAGRAATKTPRRKVRAALSSGAAREKLQADDRVAGRRRRRWSTIPAGCRRRGTSHQVTATRGRLRDRRSMRCSSAAPPWRSAPAATRRATRSICPPASCCTRSRANRWRPANRCSNCATTTQSRLDAAVALATQAVVIGDQAPAGAAAGHGLGARQRRDRCLSRRRGEWTF